MNNNRYAKLALAATVALCAIPLLPGNAQAASASLTEIGRAVSSVAVKAKPSVVGILNTAKADTSGDRDRAAGTGFVYKDGIIITNAHVVEGASELMILYSDKTTETVSPDQVFSDSISDIAVVKVKKEKLIPLQPADSDQVVVGENVIAVGNPLGFRLGNSVSLGIVSGTGRAIGSGYPFLQTDAPINPGNSGGPLLNTNGQVVGINSAKMSQVGVEGLGFAIPINTAKQIADTLIADGKVERVTIGISLYEGWSAYFGVPDSEGVTIADIAYDGPSGMTALHSGDKLVSLDNTPIHTEDDYFSFLLNKKPGDTVTIRAERGGETLVAEIIVASQDDLRENIEDKSTETRGILKELTFSQISEAVLYGYDLYDGYSINDGYLAESGSNRAVLYTEYLYIARRIASALQLGLEPSSDYQRSVARDISGKLEFGAEIHGDKRNFLDKATYTLEQGTVKVTATGPYAAYTVNADGSVAIAEVKVRFDSSKINANMPFTFNVTTADGKTHTFRFDPKDLR